MALGFFTRLLGRISTGSYDGIAVPMNVADISTATISEYLVPDYLELTHICMSMPVAVASGESAIAVKKNGGTLGSTALNDMFSCKVSVASSRHGILGNGTDTITFMPGDRISFETDGGSTGTARCLVTANFKRNLSTVGR